MADEATLKAEIPTIYNWLDDQCANTAAGCEHQTQRTQKQHIRVRIRIHLHKLPCRSIASIGVRTLNVSRHRSSQLAFLSACHCNVRHPPLVTFRLGTSINRIIRDKTNCSYFRLTHHLLAAIIWHSNTQPLFPSVLPFVLTDSCFNALPVFPRNLRRILRIQYRSFNSQSNPLYPIW